MIIKRFNPVAGILLDETKGFGYPAKGQWKGFNPVAGILLDETPGSQNAV